MRVIFAGGGTGGHLYPGLAIARALKKAEPRVEPFFIGAQRGIERDVLPQVGFAFELLDLHPLYRSRPWKNWKTFRGAVSAWRRIAGEVRSEPPACVVGTGGYASGLALAYAVAHHIPIVLQEQNTFPGITEKFFSRFAAQVHLGFPEARRHISPSKKTEVFDSGNPIEPPPRDAFDKGSARTKWGFPVNSGRVLLIYGGSQGSQAINEAVAAWIEQGLPSDLYVIWATGNSHYDKLAHYGNIRVKVRAYIAPISEAYRAADFALSRAGAMATAELCAWGIPAIVVPLPTAAADHQTANAEALVAAGAAEMIRQSDLNTDALSRAVESMVSNPDKLSRMRDKALARARPTAAGDIAAHILRLVEGEQTRL
ncbi:MAG TPA: UDP-N-acetylglucosamine--N-acetylmuramyl-(pentapeptide) pyrophosphoryl-undecaprenol N-acetylglucosamine transferase [Gemmatimonadaceae bacterium]|jgi:UDP-N-acetylglucosamine--N-acetylmuramyl-(pentapeptide) pyrophosphoryl-undecaprenol N-acetylglucosamine transferase|nr:UDP-N-acetylglucosamine--N-acetylmuramyl-(pentapeptide) pyrophosphoryl-undecaprenol N-acetylglucosamine transferase [Gemmatimonadaceae bacterium]